MNFSKERPHSKSTHLGAAPGSVAVPYRISVDFPNGGSRGMDSLSHFMTHFEIVPAEERNPGSRPRRAVQGAQAGRGGIGARAGNCR